MCIHCLPVSENKKTRSVENLTCITMKEPRSFLILKKKYLELLTGNEKNVNDGNRNDDIIQRLMVRVEY